MNKTITPESIGGVIVAGGKSSRMNFRDKPLLELKGQSLITRIIHLAQPQVAQLAISSNSGKAEYLALQLPLIPDCLQQFNGPLLGIFSAMQWYLQQPFPPSYLAVFPGDVPFFPGDIVKTLGAALSNSSDQLAWCQTGNQEQPLFSLWSLQLATEIENAVNAGMQGPKQFSQLHRGIRVQLDSLQPGDFFNINTPEDLLAAEDYC